MAQGSDIKLYAALGVLAALGGGYYMQQQSAEKEAAAHSISGESESTPEIAVSEEASKKVTKIVIEKPAKEGDNAKPAEKNVLAKEGDKWMVVEPVKALANQKNVESLLENLAKLEIKETVSSSKDGYEGYGVDEKGATHVVIYEGDKVVRELWAGKNGGRGQMARVGGTDGVFILDGYSGFMYGRDTKGWRDLSILELDPEEATAVTIVNENGEFSFKKDGDEWEGKLKEPKAFAGKSIDEFESKKVTDMLNAYKKLNASGFGDGKTLAETALENPVATITFEMGEGKPVVVQFGDSAEGSSKWAKLPDKEQIYSISSWAADWAFAKDEKFQKSDDPPPAPPGGPSGGLPGGLPPGMQMPAGHP